MSASESSSAPSSSSNPLLAHANILILSTQASPLNGFIAALHDGVNTHGPRIIPPSSDGTGIQIVFHAFNEIPCRFITALVLDCNGDAVGRRKGWLQHAYVPLPLKQTNDPTFVFAGIMFLYPAAPAPGTVSNNKNDISSFEELVDAIGTLCGKEIARDVVFVSPGWEALGTVSLRKKGELVEAEDWRLAVVASSASGTERVASPGL